MPGLRPAEYPGNGADGTLRTVLFFAVAGARADIQQADLGDRCGFVEVIQQTVGVIDQIAVGLLAICQSAP